MGRDGFYLSGIDWIMKLPIIKIRAKRSNFRGKTLLSNRKIYALLASERGLALYSFTHEQLMIMIIVI